MSRTSAVASLLVALLLATAACGAGNDAATPTPVPEGLQSFRYEITATASGVFGAAAEGAGDTSLRIHVNGEVAGPRREHTTSRMQLAGSTVEIERIRIDDRAWTRDAGQPSWIQDAATSSGGTVGIGIDSSALLGIEAHHRLQAALDGIAANEETLDGVAAERYRVPPDRLRMILGVPADVAQTTLGRISGDSTLWVTREGRLPMKLVTESAPSTGGTVQIEANIRDRNASIEVKAPGVG